MQTKHSKLIRPSDRDWAGVLPCLRAIIACLPLLMSGPAAAERGEGGTLKLLYWQAPTIVNPHLSIGTKDLSASRIVYEPLASFDKDGRMIPLLAAEIPSLANGGVAPDGRSVLEHERKAAHPWLLEPW